MEVAAIILATATLLSAITLALGPQSKSEARAPRPRRRAARSTVRADDETG